MAIAAVPGYLGTDFQTAPPGHRFSLYLEAWKSDFTLDKNNKAQTLKQVLTLPTDNTTKTLEALRARQLEQGQSLNSEIFDAVATAPFATGLGMEHPLENGFAFLNPYGLPYLPGSGVKGVLRAAARELQSGDWGGKAGWSPESITALFGGEPGKEPFTRGALSFWDVIPALAGNKMRVDVMTPHQTHYYQIDKKKNPAPPHFQSPHDSGQPNPIPFLTVAPGAQFRFVVTCESKYLSDGALKEGGWKILLLAAFNHAFEWLGFGAKTAVGYGAMTRDAKAEQQRHKDQEDARKAIEQKEAAERRQAELAQLPAFERILAEAMDTPQFKGQARRAVLFQLLKQNKITGDDRDPAVLALKDLMQVEKRWRETSTKKDPSKDHEYQDTLTAKGWLAGK